MLAATRECHVDGQLAPARRSGCGLHHSSQASSPAPEPRCLRRLGQHYPPSVGMLYITHLPGVIYILDAPFAYGCRGGCRTAELHKDERSTRAYHHGAGVILCIILRRCVVHATALSVGRDRRMGHVGTTEERRHPEPTRC